MSDLHQRLLRLERQMAKQEPAYYAKVRYLATALKISPEQLLEKLVDEYNPGPIRECENCGKPFIVDNGHRRFCGEPCANHARYERRKARRMTVAGRS